jgi:alkylation response protein AidB-like acyl-CoA dehydrogenase
MTDPDGLDLRLTDEEAQFRQTSRDWLAENLARWREEIGGEPEPGDSKRGFAQHLVWERLLREGGYAALSWPVEYGGRGLDLLHWLIFEAEYYHAGAPQRVIQNGLALLAPSVFTFGSEQQKRAILPGIINAEQLWSQGWSEPGAGSDLASLRSTAQKVDGGWQLRGQKAWTTRGAFCTHLFGLFRTEPDSVRHRGLSYLLVPLDLDGVEVRGFNRLDGEEAFAEVFFDDAFLPDELQFGSAVLGDRGAGWKVAMSTTSSERGFTLRPPGRLTAAADRLLDLWRERGKPTEHRNAVVDSWIKARAYTNQACETITAMRQGRELSAESSMVKLWWSELDVRIHHTALDLLGEDAEIAGPWTTGWQTSLSGPIYAGTNEIQRNITAERVLGLPRS